MQKIRKGSKILLFSVQIQPPRRSSERRIVEQTPPQVQKVPKSRIIFIDDLYRQYQHNHSDRKGDSRLLCGQAEVEVVSRLVRQLELALKEAESAGARRLTRSAHRHLQMESPEFLYIEHIFNSCTFLILARTVKRNQPIIEDFSKELKTVRVLPAAYSFILQTITRPGSWIPCC